MADLFEFMLGKKDTKKDVNPKREEKNNYSIFMPIGVYDGSDDDDYSKDVENMNFTKRGNSFNEPESRRGDFNPYDIEKLKSDEQLVELKRQISKLDDDIKILNDKIVDLRNKNSELSVEKSKNEHIASTYRNMVEKIIKIMPYYQEIEFTGIGTPEQWNDMKLVEIFVLCIENMKLDYVEKLKEIKQLKASGASAQTSNNSNINNIEKIEVPDDLNNMVFGGINTEQSNSNLDIFGVDIDIPDIDFNNNDFNQSTSSYNVMNTEHLSKHIEKINEDNQLKVILETIGETGLSRIVELKETDKFKRTFVNSNGEFNQGTLSKKIKELDDIEVVDVEQINTGRKGGYENIYSLSETGKQLYTLIFSAKPVESEKESIKRQHTSLEHGYFIKTVAKEMEKKGYEVFESHEDCIRKPLMSLEEGDEKLRVEADLIIKKDNVEYIVECEMGTTSDADMSKKLDKLILVTNVISFIMNNQESLNKTSSKVDKWITKKGRDNLSGYTFRFTTLDTLKKKEVWQNKGPF